MFSCYITGFSNICCCVQAEKKARICQLKLEQGAAKVAEELQKCKFFLKAHSPFVSDNSYSIVINLISFFETFADDPQSDPNATGDPYKTLFVAGLVSRYGTPLMQLSFV